MLTVYKTLQEKLQEVSFDSSLEKGVWVKLTNPTTEEIQQMSASANIPDYFFRFAIDEDDCPRIILAKNCILAIIHVPIFYGTDRYETSPLSIILTPELTVTISDDLIEILPDSISNRFSFDTAKRTQFFFQILYHADTVFLKSIRHIRKRTDEIELHLRKSTNNQEVFQLLDLEKGLTYFTAALRGNVIVAETILRMRSDPQMRYLLQMHEEDEDVLESVIIENKRALELAQTYSEILSNMMDAFSSVINNNLNHIMKFLASVTILLAIPTMLSSFWSMSLVVPWQGTAAGFWIVILLALIASGAVGLLLRRKGMF